jgi:hypothetical protein
MSASARAQTLPVAPPAPLDPAAAALPPGPSAPAPAEPEQAPDRADPGVTDENESRFETNAEKVGWDSKHRVVSDGIYFKPGDGLTVESEDKLFKLATRVRGQFYYDTEKPDDGNATQAVSLRRARVVFGGHAWGAKNVFKMELALSPQDVGMAPDLVDFDGDGEQDENVADANPITDNSQRVSRSPLLDLYMQFKQIRDLNLRIGQYKIPFNRQRVISSGDLMFVDRSIVNAEFNLDRDIGFDLRSQDLFGLGQRLRYYVGIYSGEGHSSFNARSWSSAEHFFGLNTLVRLEYLPFGEFSDYSETDLERASKPGLSIGGTFAHIGNARGSRGILGSQPADNGTTDFLLGEVDAMFKYRGLSAQSEFMLREGDRNADAGASPVPARNGWGLTGQAGYLTSINLEVAARHSVIRARGTSSLTDRNETGVVLSYYLAGHPYKVQVDYFRLYPESISDGDHVFRAQLQVSL